MSTFDGKVIEFPEIRIDYFRPSREDSQPALAYFLSHVHSDHLVGLESCKSPFVYCSPATRDILLRLEKYPHRMNFAKGILETRKQTYRHLKNLLKAIPLETPTAIELCPGKKLRVTLFDANHCVGAVMFLLEGEGKAVLYTGDIRSEPWWVNTLTRNPLLLPYVYVGDGEPVKRLDNMYLDTTFVVTGREDLYAEFPSKAAGLSELLREVAQYPDDTVFYLDAWTFGYEDVWQTLSAFLGSQIHVDDYRYGLYRALMNGLDPKASESTKTTGFYCGNHFQEGCLNHRGDLCRVHSCEKGTGCEVWQKDFVRITPIVSRHNGTDIVELGAGGGQGDLNERHELEVSDAAIVGQLMALCASKLSNQPQLLSSVLQMLTAVIDKGVQSLKLNDFSSMIDTRNPENQDEEMAGNENFSVEQLVPALVKVVNEIEHKTIQKQLSGEYRTLPEVAKRADGLPKQITFPYSRHSSFGELCDLIQSFKPKNIHPCTVDEANWKPSFSMHTLFGHLYSLPQNFRHDTIMLKKKKKDPNSIFAIRRPTSAPSSSSEYATPKTNRSLSVARNFPKAHAPLPPPDRAGGKADQTRTGVDADSAAQHSNESRQVLIDHYSPPREYKRRKSLGSTLASSASKPPGLKRSASHLSSNNSDSSRLRSYGRLTPPRFIETEEQPDDPLCTPHGTSTRDQRSGSRPQALRAKGRGISRSSMLSSPASSRLALRQEIHNAVLGHGENTWSDVGLVTTNGHQEEEEEL